MSRETRNEKRCLILAPFLFNFYVFFCLPFLSTYLDSIVNSVAHNVVSLPYNDLFRFLLVFNSKARHLACQYVDAVFTRVHRSAQRALIGTLLTCRPWFTNTLAICVPPHDVNNGREMNVPLRQSFAVEVHCLVLPCFGCLVEYDAWCESISIYLQTHT